MKRQEPYDPFRYDRLPVHRVECPWHVVEADDVRTALRTLVRFRRANPDLGRVPAESLTWGYAWTERAALLDMNRTADERTEARVGAVQVTAVFCRFAGDDAVPPSYGPLPVPPQYVEDAILDEEIARGSDSDWAHHGDQGERATSSRG